MFLDIYTNKTCFFFDCLLFFTIITGDSTGLIITYHYRCFKYKMNQKKHPKCCFWLKQDRNILFWWNFFENIINFESPTPFRTSVQTADISCALDSRGYTKKEYRTLPITGIIPSELFGILFKQHQHSFVIRLIAFHFSWIMIFFGVLQRSNSHNFFKELTKIA